MTNRRRATTFMAWALVLPVSLAISGTPFWTASKVDLLLIGMVSAYIGLLGLGDG